MRQRLRNGATLVSTYANPPAYSFETWVGDDLRTCGVVVHRPMSRACDLAGLDFGSLADAAAGQSGAAARGKTAHVGHDGTLVLQTTLGATPKVVWCGNAVAAVGYLSRQKNGLIKLYGPAEKSAVVWFSTTGKLVQQQWIVHSFLWGDEIWRGRTVLRCDALNDYAVILGSLPDDVTPEEARRALAGPGLGAKLAVLVRQPVGAARVIFYNAGGMHGAAPMTGLATLAIIARLSSSMASFISDGTVTYQTKSGPFTTPLPNIRIETDGSVTICMPTVSVQTFGSPHIEGFS